MFRRLEEAGLVARFDPGRSLTGVRLNLRQADLEALETLLLPATLTEPMGEAIEPWVERIEARIAELRTAPPIAAQPAR